ncbi:MAG: cysteine peptidase family C39 domain-containing protein [Planctomycetota bacterium]
MLLIVAFAVATVATSIATAIESLEPGPPIRDGDRRISRHVASWTSLKQRNIVMQQRDYSCGAAALATVVRYHLGDPVDEGVFLRALDQILTAEEIEDRIENGLAMSDLRRAAVRTGYQSVAARLSLEKLFEAKSPLVVGIEEDDFKHFVVYRGTDLRWVYLADPIRGNIRVRICDFQKQWQKHLVLAVAKPNTKVPTASPLSVRAEETFLGETNDQLIRTQLSRGSIHKPLSAR